MKINLLPSILVITQVLVGYTSAFVVYMYLPYLKFVSEYFHVSDLQIQITLSIFFLGLAIPRLFYGVFAEKHGIITTLLVGLFIFLFGGIICAVVHNFILFNIGRFMQGFGMSAAGVLGIPIVCHVYENNILLQERIISLLMSVTSIGPVIGILLVAILKFSDWHSLFWLTNILISICIILFSIILPKLSLKSSPYNSCSNYTSLFKKMFAILKNKYFLTYTLVASLSYTCIIILAGWLPFLQNAQQFSHNLNDLYFIIALFLVIGGFFNAVYGIKFSRMRYLLSISAILFLILILSLFFYNYIMAQSWALILVFGLISSYVGIILPICITSALQINPDDRYLNSSIYSFIMNLLVAIISFIAGIILNKILFNEILLFSVITYCSMQFLFLIKNKDNTNYLYINSEV